MAYEPIVDRIVQTKPDGTVVRFIRGFINSDDPKPVTGIYDRSELYERDTGKWYLFNMSMGEWFVPDDNTGGGSGGGSGDVEADKVIASAYSTSGAYAAGSYVTKGGKLYKAKQTVSNESWTAAHWEETKIMNEVSSIEPGTVLPDPSTGTNGMVVSVNNGEYVLANAPQGGGDSELPDPSQATEGNVLTVHNNAWIASAPQGGDSELPDASQATEGNVLTVHNGEWIASEPQGGGSSDAGLGEDVILALLQLARKVTYVDGDGTAYYNDLYTALYRKDVASISVTYNQTNDVYDSDPIDSLKSDLVVTAVFTDNTTDVISDNLYTLSGTLAEGSSTITVSFGGQTASFVVSNVIHVLYRLPSIFASNGTNSIDTGVHWEFNKQYSLVTTFTVSEFATDIRFIYGDSNGESDGYTALSTSNVATGTAAGRYLWGCGFGYNASKNFASANQIIKLVFTWETDASTSGVRNWYIRNVTAGTANNGTTTFVDAKNIKGYNMILGKQNNSNNAGFAGTISDFKIYERILTAEEITAYLGA